MHFILTKIIKAKYLNYKIEKKHFFSFQSKKKLQNYKLS